MFSCLFRSSSSKKFLGQMIKLKCHCVYFYFLKLSTNRNFFFNSTWTNLIILLLISTKKNSSRRGGFHSLTIFLKRIATSNFRDMRNLMPAEFSDW